MLHIFICPECRNEHTEPAEAHFLLNALCVECAYELELHALRLDRALALAGNTVAAAA